MAVSKKTLYIMVPVNICLWGFIGYKFYSAFGDSEADIPIENAIATLKVNEDTTTYQLSLNYPDPFLKEEPKVRHEQNNLNSTNNKPLTNIHPKFTATVTPTPSKEIKYLGLIQNKSSGAATALISINGKSYIIKKGEMIEGVNFESITDQIIIAKIGKEKLTINKS
jgi:hypothetical protein